MRSILCARLPRQKEFRKQDQNGILAQNILLCGKLRLEVLRESLLSPRSALAVKCRAGYCRADEANRWGTGTIQDFVSLRAWKEKIVRVRSFLSPRWGWIISAAHTPTATPLRQAQGKLWGACCRRFAVGDCVGPLPRSARVIYTHGLP